MAGGQKTSETIDECDGDSEDGDSDEDVSDDIDGRFEVQNIVHSFKDANHAIVLLEKRNKALGKDIATKAEIILIIELSSEPCGYGETQLDKEYAERERGRSMRGGAWLDKEYTEGELGRSMRERHS